MLINMQHRITSLGDRQGAPQNRATRGLDVRLLRKLISYAAW